MPHVVLLGDSIFDNGAYVTPGPDVIAQLRACLDGNWRATLLAVDGDRAGDVTRNQLVAIPADATHLIVSAGGNDALGEASVLTQPATSVAEAIGRLAEAQDRFGATYEVMLDRVLQRGLPTAVCTIYDANYPEPERRLVIAGLTFFNDAILRVAFARGVQVIDLRRVCCEAADYANAIEPSARGGERIAAAIAGLLEDPPWTSRTAVWP